MKTEARARQRRARRAPVLAFWDASALVPLCCVQPQSQRAHQAGRVYRQVVWWGTAIETLTALVRSKRQGRLIAREFDHGMVRLRYLREKWNEVEPSESVRLQAERLVRLHPIRTGDALQLAAALIWCDSHPRGRVFICADERLAAAAEAEGFTVVQV